MNLARMLLDAHPVASPQTFVNPSGGRSTKGDREWRANEFLLGLARDNREVSVLTTEGEWDGCDVYLAPSTESIKLQGAPSNAPDATFRVRVYAIVEGVGRTLIASGLVSPGHQFGNGGTFRNILAVQARGVRCKYEVTASYVALASGASQNWPVRFSLVASNDLAAPLPNVGVSRASYSIISTVEQALPMSLEANQATIANVDTSDWEIVSVIAKNTNGAERTLMFFNIAPVGAPGAGAVPQLSFSIPAGQELVFPGPFGDRWGAAGLHAGVSSTPGTYTAAAAGDILYQVFLR